MFGGVGFYDRLLNMWFIPLQHMKQIQHRIPDEMLTRRPLQRRPLQLIKIPIVTGRIPKREGSGADFDVPSPQETQAPYNADGHMDTKDTVVFSCNCIVSVMIEKTFLVDRYGDVYTNMRHFKAVASCAPLQTTDTNGSHILQNQGSLFRWLFEYVRRLEQGVYVVEPVAYMGKSLRMISLFPSTVADERADPNPHLGVNYSLASQPLARRHVENGVEITNSAVLVPSECDKNNRQFLWAYSMRMRLLRDHPSRPPSLGRYYHNLHLLLPSTLSLSPSSPSISLAQSMQPISTTLSPLNQSPTASTSTSLLPVAN